ncbi:MAG: hypothetical protein ACRDQZ_04480, partial [Mycobacteriales bacterium]
ALVFDIEIARSRAVIFAHNRTDDIASSSPDLIKAEYDRVIIAAGAATVGLAARIGLYLPSELEHHARFSFRLRDRRTTPPCWLEGSEAWLPGFQTYAHVAGPDGLWAVGGYTADGDARWERGPDEVARHARETVRNYVREYMDGVVEDVVNELRCVSTPFDDAFGIARNGPVLALWGENLFKMAPLLGSQLARAIVDSPEAAA